MKTKDMNKTNKDMGACYNVDMKQAQDLFVGAMKAPGMKKNMLALYEMTLKFLNKKRLE